MRTALTGLLHFFEFTNTAHRLQYVKAEHSYEVPETIAASIVGGSTEYLEWVRANTKEAKR